MNGAERIAKLVQKTRQRLGWPAWLATSGPAVLLALVFAFLATIGLFEALPSALSTGISLVLIFAIIGLAVRGLVVYRKPTEADARRLVDNLSEDRPATAMIDRPATPTPDAARLWHAHQERIAKNAGNLKPPSLSAHLRAADPFYLRFIAPGLLAGLFVAMGPSNSIDRIGKAISPDLGALLGADQLTVQAWVTPPAHTNRAPFELEPKALTQSPQGSEVTIRVNAPGAPVLKLVTEGKTQKLRMQKSADGAYQSVLSLDEGMEAQVRFWGDRAHYFLTALPDEAPKVSFTEKPTTDKFGRVDFRWSASDDYGVSHVQLVMSPVVPPHGLPELKDAIVLNMPEIEPASVATRTQLDLLRHKWAGLEIQASLRATDAGGQSSTSETLTYKLPDKLFFQPLARAAAEVRLEILREPRAYAPMPDDSVPVQLVEGDKIRSALPSRLERAPDGVRKAALMLEGLTYKPETYFLDPVLFMGFSRAKAMLNAAHDSSAVARTDDLLWAVAMRAEYGDFADAEQALEAARRALERALRDGADEDEIKRLMQAFRQAVTDYLAQQMAEALRRGDIGSDSAQSGGQSLGDNELERMMKALEELADTGATAEARQLLSDMSDMLARMKDFQLNAGQGDGEGPPPEGPLADALRQLGEQLMQQRELNDDTRQSSRQQQEQAGGENPSAERQMQDLARRQQELSDQLAESMQSPAGQGAPSEQGEDGAGGAGENGTGQNRDTQPGGSGPGGQDPSQPADTNAPPEALSPNASGGLGSATNDQRLNQQLNDAQTAQREAADALARGDVQTAERAQQRASQALGQAAERLAERADEIARAAGLEPNTSGDDPLGRPSGNGVLGDGDETTVPGEFDRQRARDILDELRRRAADRDLTPEEQDYLDRLLDRF